MKIKKLQKQKHRSSLRYWILFIVLVAVFASCTKQIIGQNNYTFTSYKLIRDWYTLDTTFVNRAILWQDDSIWKAETRMLIDTVTDKWYLMCATYTNPLHIEHWYYVRDGKKIWPSKYPLNK